MATGYKYTLSTCRPHVYLEPLQPLSPAFFFTSSTASFAFSSAFSTTAFASSFASSTIASAFCCVFSATASVSSFTFSTAPPALSLVPDQPLPDAAPACPAPPALMRLAIPRLARSFFRSFFSILYPPKLLISV